MIKQQLWRQGAAQITFTVAGRCVLLGRSLSSDFHCGASMLERFEKKPDTLPSLTFVLLKRLGLDHSI